MPDQHGGMDIIFVAGRVRAVTDHQTVQSYRPTARRTRLRYAYALTRSATASDADSTYTLGGIAGKLASYSQRPPSLPKPVFPTRSTISDESLPRHRSSTPTPEPTVLSTAELDQIAIPPVPASVHIPIQTHPDAPPPPEQSLQGSPKMSRMTNRRSLKRPTSRSRCGCGFGLEREHVKFVFSPMRRGTKRSIDLDEAADDSIGERGGEADGQLYGDVVMDDSDAEMETDLDASAKERGGHTKKDVQTKGGQRQDTRVYINENSPRKANQVRP
ncbi:hypothetical protein PISMIDRAFT_18937 [Pisolithus microcarpus 441]|uniref:Uncharacterized protein n=1 Tax=Pisolithus microcarpus 441 TaxID=765257 RepID=A0A0C9YP80_9AGAM|nr:hypothetical protein BKA83DRAFT_18937 [Pisolithus microcarpus]KIK12162.1 hypothetical protein PISMIDRAFT_18937 [Pisolithus microcarpus 441]